ncbi:MAG: S-adenosylmethionine:tRNA ribosyltransferase-isomerase, partial [Firmicutes bacterium]|nr:S-adenosylmethionine:tRNA ribosyltransferase-isomerase [Bacillota bacterium]
MQVSDFDYYLPDRLIAQTPLAQRDASRLMVVHRDSAVIEHRVFRDLPGYLGPPDVLVINDTRVIPARLHGVRDSGGRVEVLLLRALGGDRWECLVRPGKRAPVGERLTFAGGRMTGQVEAKTDFGGRVITFSAPAGVDTVVESSGEMPVPHYIKRRLDDPARYQT